MNRRIRYIFTLFKLTYNRKINGKKLDYAVENAKLNQQLIPKGSGTANSSWTSPLS